ncbi:2-hydroxyglutaryl-CoA dehydratase [Candidatus Woesearchaeota archaeon]|nr:2-hydroxyglutaryl-CoA dehydratase [Candidatus Woesearchaeota archaeon]MBW3021611.1 2-hydroxyglutaryl-CoA dehydratase [Candidatus Woesearchaeota archaeon]
MKHYLGVDVGSVSCNIVIIDDNKNVVEKVNIRTFGNPITAVQEGFKLLKHKPEIAGCCTTGSARRLVGVLIGADVMKNEITCHATASLNSDANVKTVLEIGGQDSKIIIIRNGTVVDFAMNSVCAAGTGSFLDQQANRLQIAIEEFGEHSLKSENPVRIAGKCTVFAESDMVHKQQVGCKKEDIIKGLCEALVRNYLNDVGKGKDIEAPVMFQGGVAANAGIKNAFEKALNLKVEVPEHYDVMGAIGAALIAKQADIKETKFKGYDIKDIEYRASSFECSDCSNNCEVMELIENGKVVARWDSKCGKWS